jgi:hypothetical protein
MNVRFSFVQLNADRVAVSVGSNFFSDVSDRIFFPSKYNLIKSDRNVAKKIHFQENPIGNVVKQIRSATFLEEIFFTDRHPICIQLP